MTVLNRFFKAISYHFLNGFTNHYLLQTRSIDQNLNLFGSDSFIERIICLSERLGMGWRLGSQYRISNFFSFIVYGGKEFVV